MFTTPTRLLLVLAAVTAGFAVGHTAMSGDRGGYTLLYAVAAAAVLLAIAFFWSHLDDDAPADIDPAGEPRSFAGEGAARSIPWPLFTAAAVAFLAVGTATSWEIVLAGGLLLAAAAFLWYGAVWREDSGWTPRVAERVSNRFVVPLALPIGTVLLVLVVAASLSRVFLAVDKDAATAIAFVVAFLLLLVMAFIAARPRLRGPVLAGLAVVGGAATVAAGIGGAAAGEREFHDDHAAPEPIEIVAEEIQFKSGEVSFPANTDNFQIRFENLDPDIYHNVAIYRTETGGVAIDPGVPTRGVTTSVYSVTEPLAPGTYYYRCDFHPGMAARATVR